MITDSYGISHRTSDELCDLLYANPEIDLHRVSIDDPDEFNHAIKDLHYGFMPLKKYRMSEMSVDEFDAKNQENWYIPDSYKNLDIAKWVLDQCQTDEEIQRVGEELLMFQERGLLPLLQFMKYFVDHLREHKIVWGVGRGSSVASYCLFLIGVHKINSIYYGLNIEEFLK